MYIEQSTESNEKKNESKKKTNKKTNQIQRRLNEGNQRKARETVDSQFPFL